MQSFIAAGAVEVQVTLIKGITAQRLAVAVTEDVFIKLIVLKCFQCYECVVAVD